MLNLYNIKLVDGSENLFYLAYGMPQSRTSRRADVNTTTLKHKDIPLITGNFEDILLYPNPANTFINISYFNEDGIFELYDAIGKLILKENLIKQNETQKILLPKISNGIYSYRIVFTKSNYTGKINIKQDE